MSILSKQDIINSVKSGDIVFHPYNENYIQPNSVDVTIGENIYRQNRTILYNMYKEDSVKNFWTKDVAKNKKDFINDFYQYCDDKDMLNELNNILSNISENDKLIFLAPNERILAHTNEFIGAKNNFTTMMKGRSSSNRNGITICDCAGLGDVGYINRWTMEISNNLSYPTFLRVGERIGQIVFFPVNNVNNNVYKGKYQNDNDIKNVIDNWNPENMIPKLYLG